MTFASLLLALPLVAAAPPIDDAPKRVDPPTVDHVRMVASGVKLSGFPLDPDVEGGAAFLLDEGSIVVVPREPAPKVVEVTKRPVTEAPTDALVLGLAHKEEGVRDRCQEWIEQQGAPALPHLKLALGHESAEARRRALLLLSDHPCEKLATTVSARRGDDDERVRQVALRAYAALKPADLYSACVGTLRDDPAVAVRHEAIVQLGVLGDVHAVDVLLERLVGCEDKSLRVSTFDTLRRLTKVNFRHDEKQWRAWWTNHRDELLPPNPASPASPTSPPVPASPPRH